MKFNLLLGMTLFFCACKKDSPELFSVVDDSISPDFIHDNGAEGNRYMMEAIIGGGGFIDVDQDGWLDIYLVQGGPIDGGKLTNRNQLFRNLEGQGFLDISENSGTDDRGFGSGSCFGDINNDGATDIYVTNFGADRLLRNNGSGQFTDVTEQAGIIATAPGSSCAFVDVDADGCLDIHVVNYIQFNVDNHINCGGSDIPLYCSPDVYAGAPDQLFRNRCDGTFEDVSASSGIDIADKGDGKGLGVVWFDADGDKDNDAFVANDGTRNFLFRNLGDFHFEEVGTYAGIAYNNDGKTEASMGVGIADVNADGRFDLFLTHLDFETNTLYLSIGDDRFADMTAPYRLSSPSRGKVGFGTVFLDFDLDGDPDLFVANGHVSDKINDLYPTIHHAQADQLYLNEGNYFTDISSHAGAYFSTAKVGRGTAVADYDNDGDADILIINANNKPTLLKNNHIENKGTNSWIGFKLVSRYGGREAIGTVVTINAGGKQQIATSISGSSYLSQGDLRVRFGLGQLTMVDNIRIQWPEGDVLELKGSDYTIGRYHEIIQR